MADTPNIRFKEFSDDWVRQKLGEISSSYSGGTPKVGKSEYYGGAIPFIRSGEIAADKTELFITEDGFKNSSAAMVEEGNILYALYGATSGEVSRAKLKGAINQAILAIIPNPGYDAEYLIQWLRNKKQFIINTYLQGGQGNLSGAIVKDLMVDIPGTAEQNMIGAFLNNVDQLIILHQCKCDEIIKLKKYMMKKMFPRNGKKIPQIRFAGFTDNWEQRKLGDEATGIIAGGDIDRDLILDKGRYPVIANALTNDGIVGYYNSEFRVKAPAVTITGRGDVGHARARNIDFTPVVRLLSVKSDHDVFFLENAINTLHIAVESTGVPQLTVPQLAKYELFFPKTLEEEKEIGRYFCRFDQLITLHQRKCNEIKEFKKFMLKYLEAKIFNKSKNRGISVL